jgi:uncharacterized SAM-binding protein YcdF (DUF218 family)
MGSYVVTFEATSHALRAEKVLKKAGLKVYAIPTPRHLSSNCGIAFKFPEELEEKVRKCLTESCCPFEGVYPLT